VEFADTGQLVFTEVRLDDAAVAFHFGFISEGDLIWYKPSFDPALSRVAPGEVLLRELLLLAGERGLTGFDFTRGDEAFKRRFADSERMAETYIFYSSATMAIAARALAAMKSLVKGLLPDSMLPTIRRWARMARH
jgi:CelD/BcsL family acetyltransferase involved in cellulose biosynthesis